MSQSRPPAARVRAFVAAVTEAAPNSRNVRLIGAMAALVGAAPLAVTRVVLNSPLYVPGVASAGWYELAQFTAVVGPAAAAVALGVTTDGEFSRVGLLSVGVFGLLSVANPAVAMPTVGAVIAGGWLTVAGRIEPQLGARVFAAAALVGGLTLSLAGAIGYYPVTLRSTGTALALAGMATSPLAVRSGRQALAVGGLVAIGAYAAILVAPFVSGAVALAAGGAIDPAAILLALAVGGSAATVAEGLMSRRVAPVVGGALLLAAGVPASIPRAVAMVVAIALLFAGAPSGDST